MEGWYWKGEFSAKGPTMDSSSFTHAATILLEERALQPTASALAGRRRGKEGVQFYVQFLSSTWGGGGVVFYLL